MNTPAQSDASTPHILPSTIAGSWYPGTAETLRAVIQEHLACLPDVTADMPPNILLMPHAGYDFSLQTAAYGIKQILGAPFTRGVLLAPSHRVALRNTWVAPEAEAVETPLGIIPIDHVAIDTIANKLPLNRNDQIHASEHSTQIQYPLLQTALNRFTIVPLIIGDFDRPTLKQAAKALTPCLDHNTLLVVSSDFTHYGKDFGYAPFQTAVRDQVKQLDLGACELIRNSDLDGFLAYVQQNQTTICGYNPIALMLQLFQPGTRMEKLHYATSSDDSHDFSRFVCYLTMAGWTQWNVAASTSASNDYLTPSEKQTLLRWAREAIRYALDTDSPQPPAHDASEIAANLAHEMGCFVTLKSKSNHQLRGCIGEITARRPLYQAVPDLAVASAFGDPRFPKLRPTEFDNITIEISALTPERRVDSWHDIEIGRHGMTLNKQGHMAVFLPQVAPEQGWTLEETLSHLAMKAGLAPDAWLSDTTFTVFEAIIFGEHQT